MRSRPDYPEYDEAIVTEILTQLAHLQVKSVGHFAQFVRPYVAKGYPREVAEAHRRYFARAASAA